MITRRFLSLLLLSLAFLTACSGPRRMSQVQVGVWAAEHDLWEEAVFRWSRVLQKNPSSAVAHNNLAVAYEKKGLFSEARREYEQALKIAPNHVQIKANFQRFRLAQESREDRESKKKSAEEKKDETL